MLHTWILVANSTIARIFEVEKNNKLIELELLTHPESRLHGRELTSDRPGRGFESAVIGRHAKEPTTPPKKVEFGIFAKHLSDHLETAHKEGKFGKLYLAASPQFLGLLRQEIGSNTAQTIAGEIDKDMTQMEPSEIRKHFFPLVAK